MKKIDFNTILKHRTWPTQWTVPRTASKSKAVYLRETEQILGNITRQCNGKGQIRWFIDNATTEQFKQEFHSMSEAADLIYTKWVLDMEEEEAKKKTFVVTFEATTSRQYAVQANSFEEAHTKATKKLSTDETVSEVWFHAADVVGMAVTVEGKEIIREKQ